MPCKQTTDCNNVTLPASMQTLLQRYTDRKLTEQERVALAHATPNVRCEALRIFFEMNDAAAGVEYVLANSGASARSYGGASARASRSGGSAATASVAAPSKALEPLPTNVPTAANAGAKSTTPAASGAKRPLGDSAPTGKVAVRDEVRQRTGTRRAVVPVSGSMALSPVARARSCSHRTRVARSGESVCTLVTVSSMSSDDGDDTDDDADFRPADTSTKEEQSGADMPPTVTLRSRDSRRNAGATAAPSTVPLLALDAVLMQRGSNSDSSTSSPSAGVTHGESLLSVSAAMTNTTTAAAKAKPRDASHSAAPPLGRNRLSTTVSKPSTTATAAPPLPSTVHESASYDDEPRKTVAAKPTGYYTNLTAKHTTPAPHPQQQQYTIDHADPKPTAVRGACRHDCTPTFRDPQGGVDFACTERPRKQRSPSPSCMPPSPVGSGALSVRGTDWAALVAAAPAPQLPTVPSLMTTKPAAVPATPQTDNCSVPKEAAATTPASSCCASRAPNKVSHDQSKTTPGSGSDSTVTTTNSRGAVGKTQQLRTPRMPLADRKREAEGSDHHSLGNFRHLDNDTPQLPPPPPPPKLGGASPIKRGVAWDETTGMYITHPNQLRRQRAARIVATAPLTVSPSSLVRGASGSSLEPPDTLHYCFARTASSPLASALPTSTPTAAATVHAAGSVPLGRLCSSVVHITGGTEATSAQSLASALPLMKGDKQKKRKRATKRAKALTGAPAWKKPIEGKKAATTRAPSPTVVPIVVIPRSIGYQRLCGGDMPVKQDIYGYSGETIMLQRQASQFPPPMLAASANDSPNKSHRTAPGNQTARCAAPTAPVERYYSMMKGGGVEVVDVETAQTNVHAPCPSAIRTPRSSRFSAQQRARGLLEEPAAPMVSGRGIAAERTCQGHAAAVPVRAGAVPPAHCNVFERLTSNYYDVYASEVALQATSPRPVAALQRGCRSTQEHRRPARRRHLSAPAARARGLLVRRPATALVERGGCLTREGMPVCEQGRTTTPASCMFARSNTSSYHVC
ncbi:hypothetical protein, conserved [Leishmania tarentolae]|uniref:Uncharacterized protein n=1 Tax=Leishmania tarentolae TaxID=5689 RepID=A0A640KFJ4_LEITA|nr:hypothetical protein, conserved [Leishmania tarentolae]